MERGSETTEATDLWRQPWSLLLLAAMLMLWTFGSFVPIVNLIAMLATPPLFVVGMGGIVLQAGLGIIPRWWLAVPALWLGGYYLVWNESNRAAESLIQEIAAEHAALPLSFSPTDSDVLIEVRSVPGNVQALSHLANTLVYSGILRVAYENQQNLGASAVADRVYHAVSLPDCELLTKPSELRSTRISTLVSSHRCVHVMPGEPNRPVYRVTPMRRSLSTFLRGTVHSLRVADPTGRAVIVSASYVSKLSGIPIVYFGCGVWQGCKPLLQYTPISIPSLDFSHAVANQAAPSVRRRVPGLAG